MDQVVLAVLKDLVEFHIGLLIWCLKFAAGVAVTVAIWFLVYSMIDWDAWLFVAAGNRVGVALCFTVMILVAGSIGLLLVGGLRRPQSD